MSTLPAASRQCATILSICFCCIYGLLYLASTTAFNSIVTSAVLYLVRFPTLPLPRITLFLLKNLCSKCSLTTTTVIEHHICRPSRDFGYTGSQDLPSHPCFQPWECRLYLQHPFAVACRSDWNFHLLSTSAARHNSQINYTPVISFGLFLVILYFWFTRGRKFVGPKIDWD